MYCFEIVQGADFGGYCAVSPEFETREDAELFAKTVYEALQLKRDWDRAVAESEEIEQKMLVGLDKINSAIYNKLVGSANQEEWR